MKNRQITRKELIDEYFKFFESKKHKIIPSASIIPENDPTVLFTTAGMHPLVPYLLGQIHPLGKRIVNVQKCIRTTDIEEVGDKFHHTFFEMLGNWSFGNYWKEDAIKFSLEFLTKILKIDKKKLAVSCFSGEEKIPKDETSARIWLSLGIPKERIIFLGKKDNWWGPAGKTGPCGPDTEIFYWMGKDLPPKSFDINNSNWVEIWNLVFMEYNKTNEERFENLKQKNVDTGMGVERTLTILNNLDENYLIELFLPIIKKIEEISKRKYSENEKTKRTMRIIADHLKASIFMIAEGINPGNSEREYILRRLIRRAIRYGRLIEMSEFLDKIAPSVFDIYTNYDEIKRNKRKILNILKEEEEKFNQTLEKGLKMFEKIIKRKNNITCKDAFLLYQSYGFPIEMTEELAKERGIKINKEEFEKECKLHQELSRKSCEKIFKSGLSDNSARTIKLHTATHLLNEALRRVLKKEIHQKGSNITSERLRFDFNFPRKLTSEEIKKVEEIVNQKISEKLEIKIEKMSVKKAIKEGAQSEFGAKYPEEVFIYSVIDPKEEKGWFSKEICTGPHVKNTREIGKFKILKEESISAGVRRIKATIN